MASLMRLRLTLGRTLRPISTATIQPHVSRTSFIPISSFSTSPEPSESISTCTSINIPADATTAGKVLEYLNTQCKDTLDNAHMQALIQKCTSPEDYPKLLHAMTTYKRTRGYVMDASTASLLIKQVLDVSPPDSSQGALFLLENYKERTGLYYSASIYDLNRALDVLWQYVCDNTHLPDDETKRIWKALQRVSRKLIQRKHGIQGMKKRAKRDYLKNVQSRGGPTQHTVRRVAQIGVAVVQDNNVQEVVSELVEPFQAAQVSIHPQTLEWLEAQKKVNEESEEMENNEGEADEGQDELSQEEPGETAQEESGNTEEEEKKD